MNTRNMNIWKSTPSDCFIAVYFVFEENSFQVYNKQKLTCRLTVLYRVYTQLMKTDKLLLGAVFDERKKTDALEECLRLDHVFIARVQQLYDSVMNARPLPEQIVRALSHEGDISIMELKKRKPKIRLAFYVDESFFWKNSEKAIVFLLYFPKHDNNATERAKIKAQNIRDDFLKLKEQEELRVEVI